MPTQHWQGFSTRLRNTSFYKLFSKCCPELVWKCSCHFLQSSCWLIDLLPFGFSIKEIHFRYYIWYDLVIYHPTPIPTECSAKKVRCSHDKNHLLSVDFKGVLFAGKQGGFRPVLGGNKSREGRGSALSLFHYLRYCTSVFMQKSVVLLFLCCVVVHFGNKDLHAFCQT